MLLGGIWTHNDRLDIDSYSVVTTAAPEQFEPIHSRAPIIVDPDQIETWMDEDWTKARQIAQPYAGPLATTKIEDAATRFKSPG